MTDFRILCVDDLPDLAQEYADFIKLKTNYAAIGTSDPDEALQIIKDHPIDVAVLDQRMPQIPGTDLYKRMSEITPRLKAIMLTGEANKDEAVEALQILDYVRVVNKSKIDDLIPAVQVALLRAEGERVLSFEEVEVGRTGIHWLPLFRGSTFYLQSIEIVRDAHVPENKWRYIDEVSAGQTKSMQISFREKRNYTRIFEVTSSTETQVEAKIDAHRFAKIASNLNSRIASRMQTQIIEEQEFIVSKSETIQLPPEPSDPEEQVVKARTFYLGPETIRLRLRVTEQSNSSKLSATYYLIVDHHTGHFIKKQVDTLTDGTQVDRAISRMP